MRPRNTHCQGCNRFGYYAVGATGKPRWCRCVGAHGPLVAAPGFVTVFRFESREDAERRERGRLLGNAEREARDRLSERWVACGKGYRALPETSAKVRALRAAYAVALEALESFQAECPHPSRSRYAPVFCDVCHAHVECDVAHYRHLVREVGEEVAQEMAV